jgi:hypothetical protein
MVVWMVALSGIGCDPAGPGDRDECEGGGKCDAAGSVRSTLEGNDDPIARWLLGSSMDEDGRLDIDYLGAVAGVADQIGCSMSSMQTFVLSDDLVMGEPFPRLVSTLCSDDDARASEFFIAASFADPASPHDVDARNLELFAWDATARRYRFYAALPVEGSAEVQVEVEPRRCGGCHLNGSSLDTDGMPMLPIMNELTRPWPHWNAEPDFPSHTFQMSEATRRAPAFSALTGQGRLASASRFEQIIRTAQTSRVTAARLRARRDPADLGQAMGLLRPLFCDEQVNFATEDFGAGVMPASVVITGGTRDMFLAVRPSDWPWRWLNADLLRFEETTGAPLAMVPVRGAADVEFERRLVALRALAAEDVLRIRALDWATPVFSELRCGLWKDARARLRAAPPSFPHGSTNGEVIALLYREIMTLEGHSLLIGGAGQVLAVRDGSERDDLIAALARGGLDGATCDAEGSGACVVDLNGLGTLLDRHARAAEAAGGRQALALARDRRLCVVDDEFPSRPAFPPVSCARDPLSPDMSPRDFGLESAGLGSGFGGENRQVRLIPDGSPVGVTSVIEASDAGPGAVVEVRLAIAHGWRGDLTVLLTSPAGETREVVSFPPGDSGSDIDGAFLVLFDGTGSGDGPWRLTVIDSVPGEQGFLEAWSIGVGALAPALEAPGARVAP